MEKKEVKEQQHQSESHFWTILNKLYHEVEQKDIVFYPNRINF